MPIGKVWIYRSLFFVCFFASVIVWIQIPPPRIKPVVSHFARQFVGFQGRESQIFVNFAPPEAQNWMNWPVRGPCPLACKH